jgi:hypothetical protein
MATSDAAIGFKMLSYSLIICVKRQIADKEGGTWLRWNISILLGAVVGSSSVVRTSTLLGLLAFNGEVDVDGSSLDLGLMHCLHGSFGLRSCGEMDVSESRMSANVKLCELEHTPLIGRHHGRKQLGTL